VQARYEFAVSAEGVEDSLADAGHDAHVDNNVGAVGDFDADFGNRGADRAHREGDDIEGTALHAAIVEAFHRFLELGWIDPVVGRTGIFLLDRGDVSAVFDTGNVGCITAEQVAARAFVLVEQGRCTGFDHQV